MILFLHNRYRTTGGEERVVEDLMRLVRERMDEPAELLQRGAASELPQRGAASERLRAGHGLLRGGLHPREVSAAVRVSRARVVHAHNLLPTLGWRALAAARAQGAGVVLHLHQYRLVCAVGVCFTRGEECTRCHGRNTLPGVLRNCRGSRPEALAYAAGLALWQRRVVAQADAVIVPSAFARERLRELGAPLPWERVHVLAPPVWGGEAADAGVPGVAEPYALVVSRLSPEKGIDVAIDACARAGIALVVAGEGPELARLQARADGWVRFVGHVADERLAKLRAGAALALVPSRSAETFGLAAAEAMAAGLPVAASRVGALPELVGEEGLAPAGDAGALAAVIARLRDDAGAGERARLRALALCDPGVVAAGLAAVYEAAMGARPPRRGDSPGVT
ncbi:MAG TPA: glycosyltransferase family 4 protein [Solirubrobacteraceae bacterium]|nr:glycosyltransferase family 4 protein [Solirubrobacteraceae bacterium]